MFEIKFDHLYLFIHEKGTAVPFHSHDTYEFCYYVEGSGNTRFDDTDTLFNTANYSVYKPGVVHNEIHHSDAAVLCLTFYLNNHEGISIQNGVYTDFDKIILEKLECVRHEYSNKRPGYKAMIELLIAEMLICYDRQQYQREFRPDEVSRIRALLNLNFANCINIQDLVKKTGYSYHHFRHLFKSKTGESPKNYVIRKRIEYARNMLTNGDTSISEIALISGFSSSSQFSSIFKKHTGMTPREYRLKK